VEDISKSRIEGFFDECIVEREKGADNSDKYMAYTGISLGGLVATKDFGNKKNNS